MLVLDRPLALLALVLPVLLILVARVFARPPRLATGSLCIWRAIGAAEVGGASPVRSRIPPVIWFFAACLALAALALASPRTLAAATPRTWTAVVDRSPGMYLPFQPDDARTRLDVALASALDYLRREARAGDRVRWLGPGREMLVLPAGEEPPATWLARDAWFAPRPRFEAHDLPGRLWITDRARASSRASVFASGGADAPGPIGERPGETPHEVVWRGGEATEEREVTPRRVAFYPPDEEPILSDVVASWAEARGLDVVAGHWEAALVVRLAADETGPRVVVGRDGWRMACVAGPPRLDDAAHTWLSVERDGELVPVVRWRPGRVVLGLGACAEPEGDPAAFAVSWARLLDEALLPRPGVVPMRDRVAAGAGVVRRGVPPEDGGRGPAPGENRFAALLAAAAALCALAGSATGWRR